MIYEDSNNKNNRWDVHGLKAQKEPSPGQSETSWSGTLCKMYPDGPRPAGARGNVRNVNPDETSNVPCCHFAFPFGRRRVAPLPFPSAGDLRFRAQGMWVGRDPGCRSFHSLCPGLGSSCPFGAYMSKCISVRSLFTTTKTTRTTQLGSACPTAYMSSAW